MRDLRKHMALLSVYTSVLSV